MTKYITTDINGNDHLAIEVDGDSVVGVEGLGGKGENVPTPEQLDNALRMYMRSPDATIEMALRTFIPAYAQLRKADG